MWAFSFDADNVVSFCKENGIELTDTYDNLKLLNDNIRKHVKVSITKRYKSNLNYIENWKKIILNNDGTFKVIKNDFIPFQLDIKDNYELFKKFLLKYKRIISNLIKDKIFIPTITGGLDTRGFIGLYRDKISELDGYFLTEVKQDGKNNIEQGKLELELANQVVKKIGLKEWRLNQLEDSNIPYITMTGMFNENADAYDNPNDPEYIYKLIQHGWGNKYQYINKLTPFMDDDYLIFKQDKELTKCLLLLLLAPDLLHIPFISGTSLFNHFKDGCLIYPFMEDYLIEAQKILIFWGEEKCKNILKEDD